MSDLERLIHAAQRYYDGLDTGMTDLEYDRLFNESGLTKSQLFQYVHENGDTMEHRITIPSWTKITDWTKFDEYADRTGAILTPKWDGCSTVAYYKDGELDVIMTRSGENTGKVKTNTLKSKYPHRVDSRIVAILAEALVPMSMSKTRSEANGLVNAKYKEDEVKERLFPHAFDVITSVPMSYSDRMHLLDGLMPYKFISKDEAKYINAHGNNGEYYIDGVVIYGTNFTQIFKIESATESAVSTINNIRLQVSDKTGLLTPVVEFDPVVINNITVRKVGNCGSVSKMKEDGIGVGAIVEVHLAKAVIPQIKKIITKGEYTDTNFKCPVCGRPVELFQGKYICTSPECQIWINRRKSTSTVDEFIQPPRYTPGRPLSDLQKEYCRKLLTIYKGIKI